MYSLLTCAFAAHQRLDNGTMNETSAPTYYQEHIKSDDFGNLRPP